MLFLALLVAQSTTGNGQIPWEDILKIGITPVIVVVLLLTGQLYIGKTVNQERENERKLWQMAVDAERTRAESERLAKEKSQEEARACASHVEALRQANEDKVLPALFAATQAQRDILSAVLDRGGKA